MKQCVHIKREKFMDSVYYVLRGNVDIFLLNSLLFDDWEKEISQIIDAQYSV